MFQDLLAHEDVVILIAARPAEARWIAKAMVCIGSNQQRPCFQCEHCVSIENDRHIDVLAIPEHELQDPQVIESLRRGPVSAQRKVIIIGPAMDRGTRT